MKAVLAVGLLLIVWPFSSGGKTYHMTADKSVPAANGTVRAKVGKDNGNTQLEIKVKNLARPTSLTPSANVYVVWARPRNGDAEKEGVIRVDNNLSGELKATTTLKDFEIFITAEQSESVSAPSGTEILRANVSI